MLLVQSWVIPATALRAALQADGYEATLFRVDFEPALAAALTRAIYDVVVLDSASTGLTRATVAASMREHGVKAPLIELGELADLAGAIRSALRATRN